MSMKLNLIAACCDDLGIGIKGRLPWNLKSEMKYFNEMTTRTDDPKKKNVVIMGRKTWCSIPLKFRPLANRINLVLSTDQSFQTGEGAHVANSLDSALKLLSSSEFEKEFENVWIIGGSSVYKEALAHEHFGRLYLTRVLAHFECDTFFPPLPNDLITVKDPAVPEEVQEENGISFQYLVYAKN